MFGIVDCNNFYCSCERVFHPALRTRPVVVLSNNDGCIIARSNEAKALGIEMGTPFFQAQPLLEREKVAVFSSNYTLYGDMSRRVMMLLADFSPSVTQYSIDEAFIDLDGFGQGDELRAYGLRIVRAVGKGTGVPVSLGIAPTKTLAKVASRYAKRYPGYQGVCMIDSEERRRKALQGLPVGDVWGIGRRHAARLQADGVATAWDFTMLSENLVRRRMTITGVRTWKELRGESCVDIETPPRKQSICTSRSFAGNGLSRLSLMEEAVANFTAACARKLRSQGSCCGVLTLFAYGNRFRQDAPCYPIHRTLTMPVPTSDSGELIAAAMRALRADWRGDDVCQYKKAGVIVWDICPATAVEGNLFDTVDRDKQARLSAAIDAINRKNGADTVRVATQGMSSEWQLKRDFLSARFTTELGDIIRVNTSAPSGHHGE